MKEIALLGSNGPVFATVLSALLKAGHEVCAYTTEPTKVMLDTTNVTIEELKTATKEETREELEGYATVVAAYETNFQDVANNDFILRTYSNTVNAAIEAGVKRLIVVGNPDSEAFFRGELRRHAGLIDANFISTAGDYAAKVVDEI